MKKGYIAEVWLDIVRSAQFDKQLHLAKSNAICCSHGEWAKFTTHPTTHSTTHLLHTQQHTPSTCNMLIYNDSTLDDSCQMKQFATQKQQEYNTPNNTNINNYLNNHQQQQRAREDTLLTCFQFGEASHSLRPSLDAEERGLEFGQVTALAINRGEPIDSPR